MRVLVTGADGFIGGHLMEHLSDAGHEVHAFQGDVTNETDWWPLSLYEWDAVCHLAALIGVADSMNRPTDYIHANVTGTALMVECLRGKVGRYVLASSASVYGSCLMATERSPIQPTSVYGMTKVSQEAIVAQTGVPATFLRPFMVYGPKQTNPDGGLVGIFARQILEGDRPRVTEDGAQRRDLVHVSDVCEAFRLALDGPPGVYNLGTGTETTVAELAISIASLMGGKKPTVSGQRRSGDVRHITAHISAGEGLGWKPKVVLADGLADYVKTLK